MAIVAWPPPTPPNTRANATGQLDNHPSDHNRIADALDTIIARLGAGQSSQLGYAEQVAAQSSIATTTVDLTSLSITFTLATQRRVRLIGNVWYTKNAPDTAGSAFAQIANGANVEQQGRGTYINAPGWGFVHVERTLTLAPGTYTYKLRGSTSGGFLNTGSSTVEPSILQAIDMGPA